MHPPVFFHLKHSTRNVLWTDNNKSFPPHEIQKKKEKLVFLKEQWNQNKRAYVGDYYAGYSHTHEKFLGFGAISSRIQLNCQSSGNERVKLEGKTIDSAWLAWGVQDSPSLSWGRENSFKQKFRYNYNITLLINFL